MKSVVIKMNDGMVMIANIKKESPDYIEVQNPMLLNVKLNYESGNPQLFLTRYNLFSKKQSCTKLFTYGIISMYESNETLDYLHKQYIDYYKGKEENSNDFLNFSSDIFDFNDTHYSENDDSKQSETNKITIKSKSANNTVH